jgi:uncharacterized delta-60 repeat protein
LSDFGLIRFNTNGTVDSTFGVNGSVITDIGNNADVLNSINIQSDGKILVSGSSFVTGAAYNFAVVRYNIDGSLDNSFGNGGIVTNDIGGNDRPFSMAIQNDGKIILAGRSTIPQSNFAIVRYNINGTLDNTFDSDGILYYDFGGTSAASELAIQSDGKIVVCGRAYLSGNNNIGIIRVNTDGSLDNSFGNSGVAIQLANITPYDMKIQTDGKLVVLGAGDNGSDLDINILRFLSNGTLDNTFGNAGIATTDINNDDEPGSFSIQADGKLIVGGTTALNVGSNIVVARYDQNGLLDNSFAPNGMAFLSFDCVSSWGGYVAIQPNGKIVVAGSKTEDISTYQKSAIARYNGVDNSVGLNENALNTSFLVYPNPSTGIYTIKTDEAMSIVVTNILGETLLKTNLEVGINTLNLSEQANGIYFVNATISGSSKVFKLVKN